MNYSYKQIWVIAYPVMMSVLMEQLINITDAVFLGRVGETELGASAIAGIYYLSVYMLGFGFSLGLQVMIARRNGEQNYKDTGRVFYQGLYMLTGLSVFLFIVSKLVSPFILQRVISSGEVYTAVMNYIDWRCFGLLFAFPLLALRSFYVGITNTRILSVSAFIMVFANVLLNWLLIFVAGWGISGAAIASTLSEAISLLIIVGFTASRVNRKFYGLKPAFDRKIVLQLSRLSVWSMLQSFITVAPWFIFFVIIEQNLGKGQLAIANILRSVSTLFFVIASSFGATTGSLVSNLIGAGKNNEVMPLCRKMVKFGYMLGIPLIVLVIVFRTEVLSVYTSDRDLIASAILPYMIMLPNFFIVVPAYVYSNAVMGTGNTRKAFVFQLITIGAYLVYLFFLNALRDIPLAVYWTAEHLFVILLFVFSFAYMKNGRMSCYKS